MEESKLEVEEEILSGLFFLNCFLLNFFSCSNFGFQLFYHGACCCSSWGGLFLHNRCFSVVVLVIGKIIGADSFMHPALAFTLNSSNWRLM